MKALAAALYERGIRAQVCAQILGHPGFQPGSAATRRFDRVVVAGPLGRNNGIAEGARLQHAALLTSGHAAVLVDAAPVLRRPLFRAAHIPGTSYVVHAGGPQAPVLLASLLPAARGAYRIAYCAWELPDPPRHWAGFDAPFDEIWTPSRFSAAALRRITRKPVSVVPHAVRPQALPRPVSEGTLTVLVMADSRSSLARKNPVAAIRAFRAAFGGRGGGRLVLKLNGAGPELDSFTNEIGPLLKGLDVEILRGFLTAAELSALYRRADVLLSLHRAEGFGLPIAEAMAHGVVPVATGWSGNAEFMTSETAVPVPFSLVSVEDPAGIYWGSVWAEPDQEAAVVALRRLAADPAGRARLGEAGWRAASRAWERFRLPELAGQS